MLRIKATAIIVCAFTSLVWNTAAQSQITEFAWNGATGFQSWQVDGNWDMTGFPNDPQDVADLSVALAGNLTLNLGTSGNDVTLAGLKIGGTAGVVTTDITSSGAILRLQNDFEQDLANADFNNNSVVEGEDFLIWQRGFGLTNQENNNNGDADLNGVVEGPDLVIWQDNFGLEATGINGGVPVIITGGLAGSDNRISANLRLVNEFADVIGATDLVIDGGVSYENSAPVEEEPDAGISNTSNGITTTINGAVNLTNQDNGLGGVLGLNTSEDSQGTLIVNGIIDDGANASDLRIGVDINNARTPLNTVRLNSANTYSGGTTIQRVNLELADDAALGTGTVRQRGPSNQFGYNIIPIGGDRTLANEMVVAQWQTFKGDHSVALTGLVTQTNNRGFVNLLADGKTLTLSGQLDIWEDDESLEREFEFDGTGTTIITGLIRDDPLFSGEDRRISKSGTGVLIIDVGAGDNSHTGETTVLMGNLHYADNDSLNSGAGPIRALGGAVGVDMGVAANTTFNSKIDPSSTGGLMLAAIDAAANLNFTTTLGNAAGMTVAAPETGLTYTGTITPANSTYGLGGGTGTLTLPNAQLVGSNNLEVRNGGSVQLFGDNTYDGTTTIITKYTSSHQEQAAADSSNESDATGIFYDRLVAPVLEVEHLADGGMTSSIGTSSSAPENLFIQGSTLKYVGDGDSTDRLFTIGTGGATIDASGTGALVFNNPGQLARDDAESRLGTLDDASRNPNELYDLGDTSDIVVGMSLNDPDAGGPLAFPCGGGTSRNCIPLEDPEDPGNPVTVTGINNDGSIVGMSASVTNSGIFKANTRIVFGTVERTLTLTGTNGGNNTLAPIISDSDGFPLEPDVPVPPGVVSVTKTGSGKWILTGDNTYSGDTTVEEGILSITQAYLDDNSAVNLISGAVFDLGFAGADIIDALFFDDAEQAEGTWGRLGHPTATFTSSFFTSDGLLNVGGVSSTEALAAVPEPGALLLAAIGCLGLAGSRRWAPRA